MFLLTKSHHLQGKKNPGTDRSSVESFLGKVINAKEMKIDKYIFNYTYIILFQFSYIILCFWIDICMHFIS